MNVVTDAGRGITGLFMNLLTKNCPRIAAFGPKRRPDPMAQ
jgi:hypothetical protein